MLARPLAAAITAAALLASMPVRAEKIVAIAPLSTLGAEDKSAATKKLTSQIEQAVASLGMKVVPAAKVTEAIEKAKKPGLKSCEGEAACLAELGKLVGAQIVVTGEVGGLGDTRVVYLGATDVTAGKELRSTMLPIGAKEDNGGAVGAAIRLLDPDRYRGNVHFTVDVTGATVFVNGTKVTLTQNSDLALPVGTQAIRVTHPQYHDFIKFIEVPYGRPTEVPVSLKQYPMIEHDVKRHGGVEDTIVYVDPPLWKRWYVTGPTLVVLAVGVGIIAGAIAHRFPDYDNCRKLGQPNCQ